MTSLDGYELYRFLERGKPHTADVKGATYHFQFEGAKTGARNWLRVTDTQGRSIQLSPGWSTESCWNALTTLEQERWESPVGQWKDPSEWSDRDDFN